MTNKYVPLEGALRHLTFAKAEELARLPLEGKMRPAGGDKTADMMHGAVGTGKTNLAQRLYASLPEHTKLSTIYIAADEKGAMDSICAYRKGIIGADIATRHALWAMYQSDADYIRSRTLDLAIEGGYSVFLDTTGSSAKGLHTASVLQAEKYPLTISSCWAPLPVCAERAANRERQAHPEYLLTKRLGAYESFIPLAATAQVMNIYYSSEAALAPGLVLSIKRMVPNHTTPRDPKTLKSTTNHPNLLARMIRDMRLEGCGDWMNALNGKVEATRDEQIALTHGGQTLSTYLYTTGHRHLIPTSHGRPRIL